MAIIKKFRIKSFKEKKPIIKLENISLSFKNRSVLENISFNLNQGQILGLLGPNGVGKSTIFNIITGLLKPNIGSIIINGKNVIDYPIATRSKKFKIGYVPQYGGYFHDLSLMDNLKAIGEIQIPSLKDRNLKIESIISLYRIPFMIAKTKPSNAPTPAPSVGLKSPNQIPPRTATTTITIPIKLVKN